MSEPITIKVNRLPGSEDVPLPSKMSVGAAGFDLCAAVANDLTLAPGDIRLIPCGFAMAIPPGYEMQVRPRSGLAIHQGIGLVNAPGTVDADYRGVVRIILINWGQDSVTIRRGDRIAQFVFAPVVRAQLEVSATLEDTERGEGGFGSTGRAS